jgi:hypothetical protein
VGTRHLGCPLKVLRRAAAAAARQRPRPRRHRPRAAPRPSAPSNRTAARARAAPPRRHCRIARARQAERRRLELADAPAESAFTGFDLGLTYVARGAPAFVIRALPTRVFSSSTAAAGGGGGGAGAGGKARARTFMARPALVARPADRAAVAPQRGAGADARRGPGRHVAPRALAAGARLTVAR